jgi:tRNA(adenine34) deaminase
MMLQQIDNTQRAATTSPDLQAEDEKWMAMALKAAKAAADQGEIPVGAVLVKDGTLIAAAGNQPILLHDPTAHAEIRALRVGAQLFGNYRLPGTTLYVTLEPCLMCIGAIIHARVERLVYGAADPKTGAVCSLYPIGTDPRLNHPLAITSGILETECGTILRNFFQEKRAGAKKEAQPS